MALHSMFGFREVGMRKLNQFNRDNAKSAKEDAKNSIFFSGLRALGGFVSDPDLFFAFR
jgi:hypothetical protein